MRRLIIYALTLLAAVACQAAPGDGQRAEAPELLSAVPSDALAVGVFGRCDNALGQMLDSTSVLRSLEYGRFGRHRAAVALCDVGSIVPLLIVETGKAETGSGLRAATDTLPQTATLAAQADSLRLFSAQLALNRHNVLLLTPSATVLTVVQRHISSETSILDAPYFDGVLSVMGGSDAIAWRNGGAGKLLSFELCSIPRKQLTAFLRNAAEWTVFCGERIHTVQPQAEKYYCNFLNTAGDGQSRLGSAFPSQAELIIDVPIADGPQWRSAYETLMDARVELESYNKTIQALKKSSGKNPLDWEKELNVQEVVYVAAPGYSLNMVRCARSGKQDGVRPNHATGFVRALYGEPFSAVDSCCIRSGKWIVSGPRAVLDTLSLGTEKSWPAKAAAVVQAPGRKLTWTKDNIILWQDSNR